MFAFMQTIPEQTCTLTTVQYVTSGEIIFIGVWKWVWKGGRVYRVHKDTARCAWKMLTYGVLNFVLRCFGLTQRNMGTTVTYVWGAFPHYHRNSCYFDSLGELSLSKRMLWVGRCSAPCSFLSHFSSPKLRTRRHHCGN